VQDMQIKKLHCKSESYEDTKAIASILDNLHHLRDCALLFGETASTGQDHSMITLRSRSITRLVIVFYSDVNQFRLDMPNLRCLTFYSDISVGCFAEIFDSVVTHSPHLNQLCCFNSLDQFSFSKLSRFANLTAIKMNGIGKIQEPISTIFTPKVTELELERVDFDVSGIGELLSALPNLHTLMLRGISGLSSSQGWFSKSVRLLHLSEMSMGPLVLSTHFPSLCEVIPYCSQLP